MKLKFLLPFFALIFILSCGDDPDDFVSNDDDSIYGTQDDDNNLPDAENSGNGEQNDSENSDTEADTGDDSGTNGDSDNTTTDNETTSDDDAETTPDNDTDTTPDDDTNTTPDDADSTDDSGDPQTDDDADSDTGDNDADTESGDDDADSGSDTGEEDELEVVLPYNGGTVEKTIKLNTKINKIDVLLMIDLSGFITAVHDNLKANVKTAIIDGIKTKIPDSAFGLVTFGTIEQKNAYTLAQPVTTDTNSVRNAVDGITKVTSGSTAYQNLALWEAASGEADYEQIAYSNSIGEPAYDRSITIPAVDCTGQEGNRGGACFRDNSMPVFVMASAKAFTDFSKTDYNWTNGGSKMKTKANAIEKMNAINAKFIGIHASGTSSTTNPASDFEYIAKQTESQNTADPAGYFNTSEAASGSDFSAKIAEAVTNLTDNIRLDVEADFIHNENGYGVEDTAQFIKSFYPVAPQAVKAGDPASFDITFENNFYENTTCEPHNFIITAKVTGEGLVLDSREIKVIVPGRECPDPTR